MNTLFNTTFENDEASHYENQVQLRPQMYELQESNVNLKLTIVHTVGFGDQINKEERYSSSVSGGSGTKGKRHFKERGKIGMVYFDSNLANLGPQLDCPMSE